MSQSYATRNKGVVSMDSNVTIDRFSLSAEGSLFQADVQHMQSHAFRSPCLFGKLQDFQWLLNEACNITGVKLWGYKGRKGTMVIVQCYVFHQTQFVVYTLCYWKRVWFSKMRCNMVVLCIPVMTRAAALRTDCTRLRL